MERDDAADPESVSDPDSATDLGSSSENGPHAAAAKPCLWEHRLEHVQKGERRRWLAFDDEPAASGWSTFRRLPLEHSTGLQASDLRPINEIDPLLGLSPALPRARDGSASLGDWLAAKTRPIADKLRTVERLIASWSYLLSAAPKVIESALRLGSIRVDTASGQPFVESQFETTTAGPGSSVEDTGLKRAAMLIRWALLGGGDEPSASMAELKREAISPARSELGRARVHALLRLAKRADKAELKLRGLSTELEELLYATRWEQISTFAIGRRHWTLKSLREEYGVKQIQRLRLQWIGKALVFLLGSVALPTLLGLIESYSWALVIALPFSSLLTLTFILSAAMLMKRAGSESEGVVIDRAIQVAHHLRVTSYRLGLLLLIADLAMAAKIDWSDWDDIVNRLSPRVERLGPEDPIFSKLGAALQKLFPQPPVEPPKPAKKTPPEVQPSGTWRASDETTLVLCETEITWEEDRVCGSYSAKGEESLFLLGCSFDQAPAGDWTIKAHHIEVETVRGRDGAAEKSEDPTVFHVETFASGRALKSNVAEFVHMSEETCEAWRKSLGNIHD